MFIIFLCQIIIVEIACAGNQLLVVNISQLFESVLGMYLVIDNYGCTDTNF